MSFVEHLNNMCTNVPEPGSEENIMLQGCEVKVAPDHDSYPHDAMYVHAWNIYYDEWNDKKLNLVQGK